MPIVPEGRFIPVNMDRCQDIMGGLFEHVTPGGCLPLVLGGVFQHAMWQTPHPPWTDRHL